MATQQQPNGNQIATLAGSLVSSYKDTTGIPVFQTICECTPQHESPLYIIDNFDDEYRYWIVIRNVASGPWHSKGHLSTSRCLLLWEFRGRDMDRYPFAGVHGLCSQRPRYRGKPPSACGRTSSPNFGLVNWMGWWVRMDRHFMESDVTTSWVSNFQSPG